MLPVDWAAWTGATTPQFSLDGLCGSARLLGVHDGDTVTVAAEVFPGCVRRVQVRLDGIDTPEVSSRDAAERALAERARARLVQLLAPGALASDAPRLTRAQMDALLQSRVHLVHLRCGGMDKYGRVLARVSLAPDAPHAGDQLVAEGLARPYDGGAKEPWRANP